MRKFIVLVSILSVLISCNSNYPKVNIETTYGDIVVELYPDKAPVTVDNFLSYVEQDKLGDATFYRVVTQDNQPNSEIKIEVIQGGLFEDNHPDMMDPIIHETTEETGILHTDGVISMARYGPGSATSEFFICVGDQASLDYNGRRNSDMQGFAAFGKVVEGMDIVRLIQKLPEKGQYLDPRVKILSIKTLD
jgi:peptidyl-prolyl cis-trans isomerase A (cyclophilin A)